VNLFKKKPETPGLVCRICEMEFTEPERTMRHMVKAHSKPTKSQKVKPILVWINQKS